MAGPLQRIASLNTTAESLAAKLALGGKRGMVA